MAYNPLQKLTDNLSAIRVALDYREGKKIAATDVATLQRYSGFGGIKAVLYPAAEKEQWLKLGATDQDLRLQPGILELHQLLKMRCNDQEYKEAIGSIKNSVLTAFYTPAVVPQTLYSVLKEQNIMPQRIYEPSSGAGIFITEAVKAFTGLQQITAVEKDMVSGHVLAALSGTLTVPAKVHISGFEETPNQDNGKYDLIVSNIPFGNFSVYDSTYPDKEISGKIHNYFFAKGLDKLADSGMMAYLTTDAFLNSPSNKKVREYLFKRADFISLAVMPDNLMKDNAGTEAPSHLLLVQKNSTKQAMRPEESLLIESVQTENELGTYYSNSYILQHPEMICGDEIKAGTNQYGKVNQSVWQHDDIASIAPQLSAIMAKGIQVNLDKERFEKLQQATDIQQFVQGGSLTFLPMPESRQESASVQLGLFDTAPARNLNRASDYLTDLDNVLVQKDSARIISTIKTSENPEHESIVLITAKPKSSGLYKYKLYSNVQEINVSNKWLKSAALAIQLQNLSQKLRQYPHQYFHEGDKSLEASFDLKKDGPLLFTGIKSFYKEGILVMNGNQTGLLSNIDNDLKKADFTAFPNQKNNPFYREYIRIRDAYLELFELENNENAPRNDIRSALNKDYEDFIQRYGFLNRSDNRRLIQADTTFGLTILSSLERKEGERFVKADILQHSILQKQERFVTDNPVEALARSLNEKGKVDLAYIQEATGQPEIELITQLSRHIYLNSSSREWETASSYLSGNVVEKLMIAEKQAELYPENVQLQRSLEEIRKVQPEKIPFELLDFNLGERWIPVSYYERFASHLFELDTSINYFASLDTFKVSTSGYNAKISREYAISPKSGRMTYGNTLLEHALENTTPFFSYEVSASEGKTIRVPDNEAIQLAHQKIENIRGGFIS